MQPHLENSSSIILYLLYHFIFTQTYSPRLNKQPHQTIKRVTSAQGNNKNTSPNCRIILGSFDDVGIVFFCSKRKLNKNKQTKILVDMHFVVLSNFSSLDPVSSISWLVLQQYTTQKMKVKSETFTFLQNKLSQPRLEFLKGGLLRSACLLPTPLLPSPLVLCSSLPPGSSLPANASQLEPNWLDTSMGTPTGPQAL